MGRLTPRERTGVLVGVLAMFLALDVAFLVSLVGLPFTPLALGQAIIDVLPGWISIPLIELLHFWAKALLVIGVLALFLLAGGVAGVFAVSSQRSDRRGARARRRAVDRRGRSWDSCSRPRRSISERASSMPRSASPRTRLRSAISRRPRSRATRSRCRLAGVFCSAAPRWPAVAALGGLALTRAIPIAGARLGNLPSLARHLVQAVTLTPADPEIDALPGITPRITANEDHYTVDTTLVKPRVDIATWKLDITGAVEAPFALTYDELLDLDAIEQVHTLECISNPTGGELIGTAVWTGVRMRDLLQRARPTDKAFDVVLTSVDGYVDSFPIAKAMEPETLLVYLMNGKTLAAGPRLSGAHARAEHLRHEEREVAPFDRGRDLRQAGVLAGGRLVGRRDREHRHAHRRAARERCGGTAARSRSRGSRSRGRAASPRSSSRSTARAPGRPAKLEAAAGPLTWRRWSIQWTPPNTGTTHDPGARDGWSWRYRNAGEPSAVPERRDRLPPAPGERQPLVGRYFVRGGRQ